ncbi:MAG: hypothetical protein V3R25_09675, partial [Nitrosomonadaceae bacterium]
MALVPIDMLDRVKKVNLTPLTNPTRDKVTTEMGAISKILHDDSLPESLKASRLNEKVKNYSVFADKLVQPVPVKSTKPTVQPVVENDMFASLPSTYRAPARVLMTELQKHPNAIQWNPQTQEVSVRGNVLRGSNLQDLIGDVLRTRKSAKLPM